MELTWTRAGHPHADSLSGNTTMEVRVQKESTIMNKKEERERTLIEGAAFPSNQVHSGHFCTNTIVHDGC